MGCLVQIYHKYLFRKPYSRPKMYNSISNEKVDNQTLRQMYYKRDLQNGKTSKTMYKSIANRKITKKGSRAIDFLFMMLF